MTRACVLLLQLGVLAAVAGVVPDACPDAPTPGLALGAPCHHKELNVTGECRGAWSCPQVRRQKAADRRYCAQLCAPRAVCCPPPPPPPPAWLDAFRRPPPCAEPLARASPETDNILAWTDELRDQQCEMPPAYDTEQWIPTPDVPANASVVERKCLAFQLLEFMLDEVLAVATIPGQPYFCKRWCFSDRAVAFVSGGQDAVELEFPHMALFLDDRDEAYCSGTLISESFVLTAAHCAVPSRVLLGLLRISDRAGEHVREVRRVAEHIVHPDFYRSGGAHSDIALLRLGERVRFTPHVRPACLYTGDDAHLQEAVVTGWGYQQYDSGEGVAAQSKVTSDALQKAAVNVTKEMGLVPLRKLPLKLFALVPGRPLTKCPEELATDIPHEKHICALGKKDSQEAFSDACQGDSGGPLQVMTAGGPGRCSYRVVAVVSRGRGCGTNLPGLYTSVSKFADWIQSWVWPCEK